MQRRTKPIPAASSSPHTLFPPLLHDQPVMAAKLLNLIALSSLAILATSFGSQPVNALSVDFSPNHARSLGHHNLVVKKKRAESRRCKPRPATSSLVSASSSSSKPASTSKPPPAPTSTKQSEAPPPATTPAKPTTSTKKTTAQPVSTPAPIVSTPGGGKAGLAWVNPASVPLKNFITKKTGAIYNWSSWKPAGADALGLSYAPMLWGPQQDKINDFKQLVVPGYAHVALGFNEPDHPGQAAMSPGQAASIWKQNIDPLKNQGYRLGSPAVTSGSSGKPWLQQFVSDCTGCQIDFFTVHWYGTDPQAMISYIQDFHTTFGKPIWVTEFACQSFVGNVPQCNPDQITNFMNVVTAFMDSSPFVEQYFAFGFLQDMGNVNPENQLLGSNNQPTALGWNYLT